MRTKTFTGQTYQEAINKVKAEFGDEAIIVSSRELKKKTLTSPGLYEIVVEIEEDKIKPIKNLSSARDPMDDVMSKLSEVTKEINSIATPEEPNFNSSTVRKLNALQNGENVSSEEIKELKNELSKMSDVIKFLQSSIWEMVNREDNLSIPPEFSEIYALSKASGMSEKHLNEIMKLTMKYMPLKMRKNRETIKRYFHTLLKKMVPIRKEVEVKPPHKKIMMFVGPTGVGKTTNIAKLAARYAFKLNARHKVGIITLDTYRIGAVEQLMTYAKMMRLPIETVVDPDDFEAALNALRHNDYILIDTVGSSQHDKEKIEKIQNFLQVDTFSEISVNLVLSATTKYEDLLDVYENFSILDIDTFVFTKLDETNSYGNIFSLLVDTKKPISYFSIGQEVPDDIMQANADYLLKGILEKEFN